eukprot:TRINITY_DN15824_c0_g1_i1.p1 TRINITY_DN15824_c0_g1~~TRINITY_DN15824_c0_g1_i1.p1  ORF type:complete len:218 (-),score=61.54 TRINITY_DN15824_c0_g1_i1:192-845(-)
MYKFVVALLILCFVSLISAQTGCCLPQVWEGEITGFLRTSNLHFNEYLYYDYLHQAIRGDVFQSQGNKTIAYSIIENYGDNTIFEILPTGECYYQNFTFVMEEICIPNGIRSIKSYIGGPNTSGNGQNGLGVVSYEIQNGNKDFDFSIVSEEDCAPISGVFIERHKQYFSLEWEVNYFNVKKGIRDPFVFKPPIGCVYVPPGEIKYLEVIKDLNMNN